MPKKLNTYYSGPKSVKFWELVRDIKNPEEKAAIYSMGCILQDIEYKVMTALKNALKEDKRNEKD